MELESFACSHGEGGGEGCQQILCVTEGATQPSNALLLIATVVYHVPYTTWNGPCRSLLNLGPSYESVRVSDETKRVGESMCAQFHSVHC